MGIEMTEVKENSRVYTFPGGDKITLKDVTHVAVRPSETHRLKTADGKLHIVPTGWLHVEIGAEDWTF